MTTLPPTTPAPTTLPEFAGAVDTFNRADTADIDGSTMSDGVNVWEKLGGNTIGIDGNQAEAGGVSSTRYAIAGMPDIADLNVSYESVGQLNGVIARAADADNHYLCRTSGGAARMQIYSVVGGGFSLLGTGATPIVPGDVITFQLEGTSLKGYIDGVLELDLTDSDHAAGVAGIHTGVTAGQKLDNFNAGPLQHVGESLVYDADAADGADRNGTKIVRLSTERWICITLDETERFIVAKESTNGSDWTTEVQVHDFGSIGHTAQGYSIVLTEQGKVFVQVNDSGIPNDPFFIYMRTGIGAWSLQDTVDGPVAWSGWYIAPLVAQSNGGLFLVVPYRGTLWVTGSSDDGVTWAPWAGVTTWPGITGFDAADASAFATVDDEDEIHVVFGEGTSLVAVGNYTLMHVQSTGGGAFWPGSPDVVANIGGSADNFNHPRAPTIAFDRDNVPHVAYVSRGDTASERQLWYTNFKTGSWSAPVRPQGADDGLNYAQSTITMVGGSNPAVFYRDNGLGDHYRVESLDNGETWETQVDLGGAGTPNRMVPLFQTEVDSSKPSAGYAYVYTDTDAADLYLFCSADLSFDALPTTLAPTTLAPTTLEPTTPVPTSPPPSTIAPTTPAPGPTTPAPPTPPPVTLPPPGSILRPAISVQYKAATDVLYIRAWVEGELRETVAAVITYDRCTVELRDEEGVLVDLAQGVVDPAGVEYVRFLLANLQVASEHNYILVVKIAMPSTAEVASGAFPMPTEG